MSSERPHLPPRSTTPDESESAWIVQAAGGDRSAFTRLVARHGGGLLAAIEKRVRDPHDAEDVAQEVWIKVHRALSTFDTNRAFRPWLFAIAFNAMRDERRRRGRESDRRVPFDEEDHREGNASPERYDSTSRFDEARAIDAALAAVPEPYRSAVHLVDVLDQSYEEAAAALGCALGTAKSRVHRGRLLFRERYERGSAEADEFEEARRR